MREQDRQTLLRVSRALDQREREALRIFVPQEHQVPLLTSTARRLLVRGGNRASKTLCGAIRSADEMTGTNRFLNICSPKGMKFLFVSLDFSLLSENIYRKLFEPGAFQHCKFCLKSKWTCTCIDPDDVKNEGWKDRVVDAEPLVPPRYIKRWAWLDKSRGVPAKVWLATGAVGDFRSTDQGRAKFQGIPWNRYWCDEEATNDEEIMNEIERGLIDRSGNGQITATPLAASLTMVNWSERAAEEKAEADLLRAQNLVPEPTFYEEFQISSDDNLALDKRELERFFEDMGEEEEAVRRRGEFLVQQGLVYGREFDKKVHIVDPFTVPLDWTIYEIQDPGHANAFATLYVAVDEKENYWIFDELYMRRQDIRDVVGQQKKLLMGHSPVLEHQRVPQRSIIDPAANQSGPGMPGGKTIRQLIHAERKRQNHRSYEGGFKTFTANNEVQAGIFAVKALLRPREDGEPRLKVMRHCNHFLREIRRYRWPRPQPGKDLVEKQGPIKKDDHLMDTVRYMALSRPEFVHPTKRPNWGANPRLRNKIRDFMDDLRKKKQRKRSDALNLLTTR